jgi:hypothetical protein
MSVSDSNNNIRIRTTPLGSDKYVKIKLDQNFDFLEILSLRIGQEEIYKKYCSDYGVIVGRVICNNGVGVPNARVSVFIPITEEDKNRPLIRAIYPFEKVSDSGYDGIVYNLLPSTPLVDDICFTEVGSFPEKRKILDCSPWCEVYGKYYKFTTTTNLSGDYAIFGVPTGLQVVHMDVDLSDIGYLSQKPYDMINQGSPEELFDGYNKFKKSEILSQLPQVKTQNKTINVLPLWGDLDECEVGINRVDFDLKYNIEPTAFFIGSIFGDSEKNSVNKNCRPRPKLGELDLLIATNGTIKMIRRTPFGGTESYSQNGDQLIDENGVWVIQLPMNLDHKITDEFGNLVDSGNPEKGIATTAKYRFMIGMNDYGGKFARARSRANYLVPNYGDYSFDDTTPDFVTTGPMAGRPNFANLKWNGVYTVKQFISRYSNGNETQCKDNNFIGIKHISDSNGVNASFPFNRYDRNGNILFTVLCLLFELIAFVVVAINAIISAINTFFLALARICVAKVCPFESLRDATIGCLEIACADKQYAPGCFTPKVGQTFYSSNVGDFLDCIQASLAEALNIFSFYFTNDWINGSLYAFLFKIKFKRRRSPKFCRAGIPLGKTQYVKDQVCRTGGSFGNVECSTVFDTRQGIVIYSDEILYYAAYIENWMLFPTDIYDLGSMKNCDVFGRPRIVNFLPATTYNLPEIEEEYPVPPDYDGDVGIDDLLLKFTCLGISQNPKQCKNLARICELYVDPDYVDNEPLDITSLDDFDDRSVRANLECLNAGLCNLSVIDNPGTALPTGDGGVGLNNSDWVSYRGAYIMGNNNTKTYSYVYPYSKFDEEKRNFLQANNAINNSFYFYFGLKAGSTAIDILKSKYFSPCERVEPCPILIEAQITNNECSSGSTGQIKALPKYGTPPYRYKWYSGYYNGNSNDVPICTDLNVCTDTISNQRSGDYTVLVFDNVGQICKKSFRISDPAPFNVIVDYTPYICPGANNGYISILPQGGVPPYKIVWSGTSGGTDVTFGGIYSGNSNNFFIDNLRPTSLCNNNPPLIGSNSVTNYITNGNFTSDLVGTWDVRPGSFITWSPGTIFVDNYGDLSQNFSISPPACQTTNCYRFSFQLRMSPNPPSTVSPASKPVCEVYLGGQLLQVISGTPYNTIRTFTYTVQSVNFVQFKFGLGSTINQGDFNLYNVSFTRINSITGNTASYYNATITDSSTACPGIISVVVDVTQSCFISVTGTTVGDYCNTIYGNALGSGSITWGLSTNQGVPPFTYILESTDGNYPKTTWTEYDRQKTVTGLIGGVCPGYTYTATCIDSCGSSASTTGEIFKCDGLKKGSLFIKNRKFTATVVDGDLGSNNPIGTIIDTNTSPRSTAYGTSTDPDGDLIKFPNSGPFSDGNNFYFTDFIGCARNYDITDCYKIGENNFWGWWNTGCNIPPGPPLAHYQPYPITTINQTVSYNIDNGAAADATIGGVSATNYSGFTSDYHCQYNPLNNATPLVMPGTTTDASHFVLFPPLVNGNPSRISYWERGMGLDILRYRNTANPNNDIIEIHYYTYEIAYLNLSNNIVYPTSLPVTYNITNNDFAIVRKETVISGEICRNDDYLTYVVYVKESTLNTYDCNIQVKSKDCQDEPIKIKIKK